MRTLSLVILLFTLTCPQTSYAQPVFTGTEIFPPEEFAARRAKVLAEIGEGVAILQGTTERPGEQPFRQSNQFFYLTGVVEPRAIAVIDGRTKKTTIFLQPFSERHDLPADLQRRHVAVEIDTIQTLQIKRHVTVEEIVHRHRRRHHHSLDRIRQTRPAPGLGGQRRSLTG